jgi:hypothetical protein
VRAYTLLAQRARLKAEKAETKGATDMAIYHLSAKIVGRSSGRSSVAAAAYRSASKLHDERTGQDHDYTRKGGVVHSEILAPPNAPEWMFDRAALWNAVEQVEKRRDAQLAREIEVALPRELERDTRTSMVRQFIQKEFVDVGMIADLSVHEERARDGGEQPHAHIMLTTRELMGEGFGPKNRDWNATDRLEGWRERWAEHVNAELERKGHEARIDHRSLEAQRDEAALQAARARQADDGHTADRLERRAEVLDREPEPKLGPIASQMEKLGNASRRGDERRAVEARNAERRTLQRQSRELATQMAKAARQMAKEAKRRLQKLTQRLEAAYRIIRERAVALKPPTQGQALPPTAQPVVPESQLSRDEILGKPGGGVAGVVLNVGRDAILGRKQEDGRKITPDTDALLGRGQKPESRDRGQSKDDEGYER